MIFPKYIKKGDTIGVTATSSGIVNELKQKMEEAKNLLRYTDYPCRSIAASLSFSSQSHFIQLFQKYTHLTPKQYRNQQSRNNMIDEPEEIES